MPREACQHGHVWTVETTLWVKSHRHGGKARSCRLCSEWRRAARKARKAGLPVPARPAPDAGFKQFGAVPSTVTLDEVMSLVDVVGSCWVWRGEVWPDGTPRFEGGVAVRVAARAAWGRPLPMSVGVEMVCGTDRCVNPEHARLSSRQGWSGWCAGGDHPVNVSPRLLRAGPYVCDRCRGTVLRPLAG